MSELSAVPPPGSPLDFDTFQKYVARIREAIGSVVVAQKEPVEQLLICSLCGGHSLMVGVPGLAKTLLVRTLAQIFSWKFRRIQFTPDLMPADIIGFELLAQSENHGEQARLAFRPGPIFANLVLADEINRAPPKTQSALLEVMQEHCVTVGGETRRLDEPFLVIATQNPIEQEGTYPLPEAQLDRFMFEVRVEYPEPRDEEQILLNTSAQEPTLPAAHFQREEFLAMQSLVRAVPAPPSVVQYCVALSVATRPARPEASDVAKKYVEWGAGPRASQTLLNASKARALLQGRSAPTTSDVAAVALPALRHRIIPNYQAIGEGFTVDRIIGRLLEVVPRPA